MTGALIESSSLIEAATVDDGALHALLRAVISPRSEAARSLLDATDRRLWERILRAGAAEWHSRWEASDAQSAGTEWLATATRIAFTVGRHCAAESVRRQVLVAGLRDNRPAVRAEAVELLGCRDDESLLPEMEGLATDSNDHVRAAAIRAIAQLHTPAALPVLLRAIERFDIAAAEAVIGLQLLGPVAVPALLEALQHGSHWTRWHAARALGAIGDERAIEPLIDALADSDAGVRWQAMAALAALGPRVIVPLCEALETTPVSRWLADGADRVLRRVAHGHLRRTVGPLREALHHIDAAAEVPVQAYRVKQALQEQA